MEINRRCYRLHVHLSSPPGFPLQWLRRPIGRMTVMEQQIEGEYRYVNSRIITNGEEIAFYQGAKREHWVVSHTFDRLLAHLRRSQIFRYTMGVVDSLVAKCESWEWCVVSLSFCHSVILSFRRAVCLSVRLFVCVCVSPHAPSVCCQTLPLLSGFG